MKRTSVEQRVARAARARHRDGLAEEVKTLDVRSRRDKNGVEVQGLVDRRLDGRRILRHTDDGRATGRSMFYGYERDRSDQQERYERLSFHSPSTADSTDPLTRKYARKTAVYPTRQASKAPSLTTYQV